MSRVSLTGGITFEVGDVVVGDDDLRGRRARLALAVLLLERHERRTREQLADVLWDGDELPPTWDSAVRNVLSSLGRALAPLEAHGVVVDRDRRGYALLLPDPWSVDVEDAQVDLDRARVAIAERRWPDASAAAQRALAVLERPLLPGLDGAWVDRRRARAHDARLEALGLLAEAALRRGDPREAVVHAEVGLGLDPLREQLHRVLMEAHWVGGSRGEALRAYSRCRELLAEELGVDPAPATEGLYLSLLGVEGPQQVGGAALPALPALVGREADLARVDAALHSSPLVTLTGLGGVGKTSLALAVAHVRSAGGRPVRWVELAAVGPDAVAAALAHALEAPADVRPTPASAVRHLAAAGDLVVLDNCEHVRGPVGEAVAELLAIAPDVTVLCTSRGPLHLPEERVEALGPLALPRPGEDQAAIAASPAVALFAARALGAGARLADDLASWTAVARLCQRLDGLPLALELAAARSRVLTPGQIEHLLAERFRLLRTDGSSVDERHAVLADTLAWSVGSLAEADARAFRCLGVLRGAFSLEAAAAVLSSDDDELHPVDALDRITTLVEESLVSVVPGTATEPRYRLLETVRAFATELLDAAGEAEAVSVRHVRHFLARAEVASAGLRGPDEADWVRAVHAELPDLLAALERAAALGLVDEAVRFGPALFEFAFHRMQPDVGPLVAAVLELPGAADHPEFPAAAAVAGYLAWQRGDQEAAATHLAAAEAGDGWLVADAWGTVGLFRGDVDGAVAHWQRAHEHAVADGDPFRAAVASSQLSFGHLLLGRDDAIALAERSWVEAQRSGSPTARAQAAWAEGLARFDTDPVAALVSLERCVALARTVDNSMAVGSAADPAEALRTKVEERTSVPDVEAALAQLEYWVERGNVPTLWVGLRRLVRQLAELGLAEPATRLAGAEAAAGLKIPPRAREQARHDAVLQGLAQALGPDEHRRLLAEGAALDEAELLAELRRVVAWLQASGAR